LYGYETWLVTLREEFKLRVFRKRWLRKFEHKSEEAIAARRKSRNQELHDI
jgi:hypothetical protein